MEYSKYEFGQRIQEIREVNEMTQEQLAEETGTSKKHISGIERGAEGCSFALLVKIALCLNVSTDYLLMGQEPPVEKMKRQLLEVISNFS